MTRKAVIHVGLPKTGTSALQDWCYRNRENFLADDIAYPPPDSRSVSPKHQYIVEDLFSGHANRMREALQSTTERTVILTTEGLTNHLYDFSDGALEEFRAALRGFGVQIFLVVRDKEFFLKSYYKQAVINPPILRFNYATSLSLDEFSALERTRRLADYDRLASDLSVKYGAANVVVSKYEGDWLSDLTKVAGITTSPTFASLQKVHVSVSDDVVEIVRQVNGKSLTEQQRSQFLAVIQNVLHTEHNGLRLYARQHDAALLRNDANLAVAHGIVPLNDRQQAILAQILAWLTDRRAL
ncbi:hypothetical protein [Mesorhizobium australicum]|uniref:Sulfotransferase family protein n=1 Tax=Mesorhizobium australicum TaxID=536018 RepID=A0A1X7PB90_9HYPH|nr:hypothetical protein [Mesorhizobium australicum]SMH47458.1 hypothetical protein SAMN02982922_3523 [Mesorhizobium australicum]